MKIANNQIWYNYLTNNIYRSHDSGEVIIFTSYTGGMFMIQDFITASNGWYFIGEL